MEPDPMRGRKSANDASPILANDLSEIVIGFWVGPSAAFQ